MITAEDFAALLQEAENSELAPGPSGSIPDLVTQFGAQMKQSPDHVLGALVAAVAMYSKAAYDAALGEPELAQRMMASRRDNFKLMLRLLEASMESIQWHIDLPPPPEERH